MWSCSNLSRELNFCMNVQIRFFLIYINNKCTLGPKDEPNKATFTPQANVAQFQCFFMTVWNAQIHLFIYLFSNLTQGSFVGGPRSDMQSMFCNVTSIRAVMSHLKCLCLWLFKWSSFQLILLLWWVWWYQPKSSEWCVDQYISITNCLLQHGICHSGTCLLTQCCCLPVWSLHSLSKHWILMSWFPEIDRWLTHCSSQCEAEQRELIL